MQYHILRFSANMLAFRMGGSLYGEVRSEHMIYAYPVGACRPGNHNWN